MSSSTYARLWMCCSVLLSLLVIANFVTSLAGLCELALVLILIALFISLGALGAAGLVFLGFSWELLMWWLYGEQDIDGPSADPYAEIGHDEGPEMRRS